MRYEAINTLFVSAENGSEMPLFLKQDFRVVSLSMPVAMQWNII